jgi:hypothetical protein
MSLHVRRLGNKEVQWIFTSEAGLTFRGPLFAGSPFQYDMLVTQPEQPFG